MKELQSLSSTHATSHETPPIPRFISLDGTDIEAKRQQLLDYFIATWEQYEALFILPGELFGIEGDYFRVGFGKADLSEALARISAD